ncbi:MAG TPA: N-formylglutamate amidohydrolase [Steroidobacteraceae bacterium]|nr:N-formylglutamate amidohydrolase [Steroidobacteraceae bacterium]
MPPTDSACATIPAAAAGRAGARPRLLGEGDPPPFELHHAAGRRQALIVCDHASRAFPRALGRLGLPDEATWRHIAWDIGAAELARALSARLDAPALLAGYSRLVVDCNRRLEDPSCFVAFGDGQRVPGNEALGEAERRQRAAACHEPYHKAIASRLHEFRREGRVPALIAVHSFTPVLGTEARPWNVGVLWDRDPRMALPLLTRLRAEPGLVVGDNQPYSGRHPADYTVDHHADSAGLPHVCLEVRQDELLTPAGIARWAEILGRALADILADESLYAVWQAREPRSGGR